MDDFNKTIKYDLRETRFSQNYQHSIEFNEKEDFDNHVYQSKNDLLFTTPSTIRNSYKPNFFIQDDQSFVGGQQMLQAQSDILQELNQQKQQQKSVFANFSKSFSYLQDGIMKKQSITSIYNSKRFIKQTNEDSKETQAKNSQSQDSDDVFSEKISLIRSLQQKLSSLHQRIKIPSNPVNNYFNDYKQNLQKQYAIYSSTTNETIEKENSVTNDINQKTELSQISQTFSEGKSFGKHCGNESIQSESMLLDRDEEVYEKEIPTTKIIGKLISGKPEVQIIETIRIVEVPYLIEVNREHQQKIESKKSFYFEENEEIHKTFEEFTQKESLHQHMLSMQTMIKHETSLQEFKRKDTELQYSGNNDFQILTHINKQGQSHVQNSLLSANESNRTFHNGLKQKRNDISFNYEENSQILSKLLTKHNRGEFQELEEKLKTLEIENSELKQKVKEFSTEKKSLELERQELAEQLIRLSQSEEIYQIKLTKYKQRLQNIQHEFAQILYNQQTELKKHYEIQIEQFENQQSEYANRIIAFEQMFEEQKEREQKTAELIESQNQQIQDLQRICKEKDLETEAENIKRRQLQEYVVERETQLKSIIENLQKDNTELKHIINQIQNRYEEQGFYILKEEAEQLKKTIEEKDVTHIEELDRLETRYSALIEKYQAELETMKRGLEKVILNKSTSVYNAQNYSNSQYIQQRIFRNNSLIRKRENILFSKVTGIMKCSQFGGSNSQIKQFSHLKMRHVESMQNSDIDENGFLKDISVSKFSQKSELQSQSSSLQMAPSEIDLSHELLVLQMQTLREQNSKLQVHLSHERQQKQSLSSKLVQINQVMNKYIAHITESQSESQKNQQTFTKCVQQLQKQYTLNKKLKQKLTKLQSLQKSESEGKLNDNSDSSLITSELIKVHPIYIQLSKKYNKSRKYIKILEKQLLDLTTSTEFGSQNNQKCCKNKQLMIDQLKSLASDQSAHNEVRN